jgi:hypothetical protein
MRCGDRHIKNILFLYVLGTEWNVMHTELYVFVEYFRWSMQVIEYIFNSLDYCFSNRVMQNLRVPQNIVSGYDRNSRINKYF